MVRPSSCSRLLGSVTVQVLRVSGPTSAGQSLLAGEEGGPVYKYLAILSFLCTGHQKQPKHKLFMIPLSLLLRVYTSVWIIACVVSLVIKDTLNHILNFGVYPVPVSFQLLQNSINIQLPLHISAHFCPLYDCISKGLCGISTKILLT